MAKPAAERLIPLIIVARLALSIWWVWCVINRYRGAELPIIGYVDDERGLVPALAIGIVCAIISWIVWIIFMLAIVAPLAALTARQKNEPGD